MSNNFNKISVIIPVYNSFVYLRKCLDSIVNQSYKNLEIILIDDGSTDGSGSLCDEYAKRDDRIIVKHQENKGPGAARNIALNLATGYFLSFVDSDDYLDLNAYEMLVSFFSEDVDVVIFGRYDIDNDNCSIGYCPKAFSKYDTIRTLDMLLTCTETDSSQCDKLFKRELWKGVYYPENVLSEDVGIIFLPLSKCRYSKTVPIPLYYYNHHNDSRSSLKDADSLYQIEHSYGFCASFVMENFPSIKEHAILFHFRSIDRLLNNIVMLPKKDYLTHKKIYYSYRQTLRNYYNYLDKGDKRFVRHYLNRSLRLRFIVLKTLKTFVKAIR